MGYLPSYYEGVFQTFQVQKTSAPSLLRWLLSGAWASAPVEVERGVPTFKLGDVVAEGEEARS